VTCIALRYSMPLLGHGAVSRWHMLLHGTHVLGAGIWVGTLRALVLIRVPSGQRLTLLRGLSPLALGGAMAVGLAGIVMAWSYLYRSQTCGRRPTDGFWARNWRSCLASPAAAS
jgi:putative copper export protein